MNTVSIRSRLQRLTLLLAVTVSLCVKPDFRHQSGDDPTNRNQFASTHTGRAQTNNRLIVTLDDTDQNKHAEQLVEAYNHALDAQLQLVRIMSGGSLVLTTNQSINPKKLIKQLSELPGVLDVVNDALVHVSSVDDPQFDQQWQLHSTKRYVASLNLPQAWDITHGSADVVVAVVDTGIDYNHPDLSGRLLTGYDFVSSVSKSVNKGVVVPEELAFLRSHDGDGRDLDASDPGDAVSEETRKQFDSLDIDCYVGNSSWHGTAMASIIAANVNDGIGIAGIDWHAKILPVRAIGKCGGHRSDMLDAIRWAAGVYDPSLPPNPTPARIINLSLGVDDLCTNADQRAINDAVAAGALVVAAVGNNGHNTDARPSSPSHCQNVIGVMAVDKYGLRANYSNFGRDADVAAPGGDVSPSLESILVATNKGSDMPAEQFGYRSATGTSVAAPHVAGVLALMLSVKPALTNRELEALMLDNARPFPRDGFPLSNPEMRCDKAHCGSGILDAYAAVQAVNSHELGTFLDSPSLAAVQSALVSVGGYHGFGCALGEHESRDPTLPMLCLSTIIITVRRMRLKTKAIRVSTSVSPA